MLVKGAASQSGNLLQFQNSWATVLGGVTSAGKFYSGAAPVLTGNYEASLAGIYGFVDGGSRTGATTIVSNYGAYTIASDVTSNAYSFRSSPSTAAASFALTSLTHYYATDIGIGAGSAVTNQHGFRVTDLTSAGVNYGFHGILSAGSSKWNLWMGGTAQNFLEGSLGIGIAVPTSKLHVSGGGITVTGTLPVFPNVVSGILRGGTTAINFYAAGTGGSDTTTSLEGFRSGIITQTASYNTSNVTGFKVFNMTLGSGSTVTTQNGLWVAALSGATNQYGARLEVASSAANWNVYASGTAQNYFAGFVGLGTAGSVPTSPLHMVTVVTSQAASNYAALFDYDTTQTADNSQIVTLGPTLRLKGSGNITSTVKGGAVVYAAGFNSNTATVTNFSGFSLDMRNLSTGTVTNMQSLWVIDSLNSGGGTITNLYGVRVNDLTVGTNNYGVASAVTSGAAKWNIYASGSAKNYFAGTVGIGQTSPTASLHIQAGTTAASTAPIKLTSGSLMSSAEAGAIEFLTDAYYGTITTGVARKTFAFLESPSFTTPTLGVASATSVSSGAYILSSVNAQTGTTYTNVAGDNGKTITCSNAGAITFTVTDSGMASDYTMTIYQLGAGQVSFVAGGTAVLRNVNSQTKIAGQWGVVVIKRVGSGTDFIISGSTGA